MILYKSLFDKLSAAKLTSYKLRKMKDPIIAQATLTRLKRGDGGIDNNTLNRLCKYFNCQPGDLMAYIPEPESPWQSVNIETGEFTNTNFTIDDE